MVKPLELRLTFVLQGAFLIAVAQSSIITKPAIHPPSPALSPCSDVDISDYDLENLRSNICNNNKILLCLSKIIEAIRRRDQSSSSSSCSSNAVIVPPCGCGHKVPHGDYKHGHPGHHDDHPLVDHLVNLEGHNLVGHVNHHLDRVDHHLDHVDHHLEDHVDHHLVNHGDHHLVGHLDHHLDHVHHHLDHVDHHLEDHVDHHLVNHIDHHLVNHGDHHLVGHLDHHVDHVDHHLVDHVDHHLGDHVDHHLVNHGDHHLVNHGDHHLVGHLDHHLVHHGDHHLEGHSDHHLIHHGDHHLVNHGEIVHHEDLHSVHQGQHHQADKQHEHLHQLHQELQEVHDFDHGVHHKIHYEDDIHAHHGEKIKIEETVEKTTSHVTEQSKAEATKIDKSSKYISENHGNQIVFKDHESELSGHKNGHIHSKTATKHDTSYSSNHEIASIEKKEVDESSSSSTVHSKSNADTTKVHNGYLTDVFTEHKDVSKENTKVKHVDVSKSTEHKDVSIENTKVKHVDVSKSTEHKDVSIENTKVKHVDVSKSTEHKDVSIENTKVKHVDIVDVSKSTEHKDVSIENTKVKHVDVSKSTISHSNKSSKEFEAVEAHEGKSIVAHDSTIEIEGHQGHYHHEDHHGHQQHVHHHGYDQHVNHHVHDHGHHLDHHAHYQGTCSPAKPIVPHINQPILYPYYPYIPGPQTESSQTGIVTPDAAQQYLVPNFWEYPYPWFLYSSFPPVAHPSGNIHHEFVVHRNCSQEHKFPVYNGIPDQHIWTGDCFENTRSVILSPPGNQDINCQKITRHVSHNLGGAGTTNCKCTTNIVSKHIKH